MRPEIKEKVLEELMEHIKMMQGAELGELVKGKPDPLEKEEELGMPGMGEAEEELDEYGKPKGVKVESIEVMGSKKPEEMGPEAIEKMESMGDQEMSEEEIRELLASLMDK